MSTPYYRIPLGRPRRRDESGERASLNYRSAVNIPVDLYRLIVSDCSDPGLGYALSNYDGPAALADYFRAGSFLLHLLLNGPSRHNVLYLLNLTDNDLRRDLLARLHFEGLLPEHPDWESPSTAQPDAPWVKEPETHSVD